MNFFTVLGCIIYCISLLHFSSAEDPLEGSFKLGKPCFKVTSTPTCTKTLAESYEPENPKVGVNEPTTGAFLFTPKSPNVAEPLHLCGGKLPPGSTFDTTVDTEIFIHGWLDGVCRTAWMREIKEQIFRRGKYNVILIDWSWGNLPDYFFASVNCKIVGEQVGFIINNIIEQTGVSHEKFHLIGHSFGAIAAGYAGRKVEGGLIKRITGLDPALAPLLEAPPEQRLTYRDAKIVDIIHSNGGNCFANAIGDSRQLGHADFYPNGGTTQLSCIPYIFISLIKGDIFYGLSGLDHRLCSHTQALQFYRASINPKGCQFVGVESSSYTEFLKDSGKFGNRSRAVMGMDYELYHPKNDKKRRNYYLKTSLLCPYYEDSYLGGRKYPSSSRCAARRT